MANTDHYIFMDGCIVKGCRTVIDFDHTFGEYADQLQHLYDRGGWGWRGQRRWRLPVGVYVNFRDWAEQHIHVAQSTQSLRTGAARIADILAQIAGDGNIHFFGTSAAGAAFLEYCLLTDPARLYAHESDPRNRRVPAPRYRLDPRLASFTSIDAPTDWVPLRRARPGESAGGRGTVGAYLAERTRIKAGPGCTPDTATNRLEDVPDTWVGATPVAGLVYDPAPHFAALPPPGIKRHIYTGGHMSQETRAFLERVWQ